MLLHKWCQLLMRTMSPLSAGLILAFLIVISSSHHSPEVTSSYSTHESRYLTHAPNYSSHSSVSPTHLSHDGNADVRKHVRVPFAKEFVRRRTKASTQTPRNAHPKSTVRSTLRPSDNSGRGKAFKRTILPNLKLRSKMKVRNGSEANSTIIFLPRLSRAMVSFGNVSVDKDLQPIIVSIHRRVLIDPKDFTISRKSTGNSSSQQSIPKKREIPSHFTAIERRNSHLNQRAFLANSNNNRPIPNSQMHGGSFTDREVFKSRQRPDSKLFVRITNENENGASIKKKSTILQVSSAGRSRNPRVRNGSPKNRRRGRHFDLEEDSTTNGRESVSEIVTSETTINKPPGPNVADTAGKRTTLFDYAYYAGTQRNSKPINTPQSSITNVALETTTPSIDNYGASYTEKKAKNLTIYEILKPKLKGSEQSNLSSALSGLTDEVQNDTRIPENVENIRNEIQNETPPFQNSMVILPSRSDSSYGIEYVIVNRSESAVISPLKLNESPVDETQAFGKRNNNSSALSHSGQEPKILPSVKIDIHQKGEIDETQIPQPKDLFRLKTNETMTARSKESSNDSFITLQNSHENIQYGSREYVTQLYESDSIRNAKMAADRTPMKNLKLDSKMFYDYFAKKPIGNVTIQDFPYPEFRPGNMFRYSDIYNRKPILDMVITRPPPFSNAGKKKDGGTTQASVPTTTFNSLRTSVRVLSTFYPNRMQDATMKFGNRMESTTLAINEELPEFHQDDEFDEYRDAIDPGFTMEKLAYLLIGTCCGLSILCLFVVVVAIKCRRSIVEKRLKAQFKKRMYYHEKMKEVASPWQQQMFDHFMYLHRRPGGDSSCSRSTESCNCRCVTWSLGARNLDSTRPLCSTNRSSSYLCGQKKLPFGAASTLRYESMLGRKRTSPETSKQKNDSPNTDSSHENDSLDIDSDSREGDGPKQCTCIDYNIWPMPPSNVPRGFFTMCPNVSRYNLGNCSQHPPVELRTISRDIPPPVTGSNYLDRSEGVVYWSSNDERLI